jgi:hypothetical protein
MMLTGRPTKGKTKVVWLGESPLLEMPEVFSLPIKNATGAASMQGSDVVRI